jgi:peroxiredoxin
MIRCSVLLLLVVLTVTGCNPEQRQPPVVGKTAPDFVLKDLSGREIRLSDLRGKVVLVNFWATWCPPCRNEIPSMQKLNEMMAGKPFKMLAISVDNGGKEVVEDYFRKSGNVLPVLLDSQQKISKMYGTTGVPETFIVDRNGTIIDKVIGPLEWDSPRVVQELDKIMKRN